MKILFLSDDFLPDSDVVGGASIATITLAKAFSTAGHDVSVISASKDLSKCGSLLFEGISVERVFSQSHSDRWRAYRSIYNASILKEIENKISRIQPDIVVASTIHLYISYFSLVIARRYAQKVFLISHDIMPFYPGTFTEFIQSHDLSCPKEFNYKVTPLMLLRKFRFRYNPMRNFLIKLILRKIDGVIAVSEALKEALRQNGIKNITVIRNGIETSDRKISDADILEFKNKIGCDSTNVILFGGRLSGAKGGALIIDAVKKVSKEIPSVKLLVAGKKDFYADKMQRNIHDAGIAQNVIFTGWLEVGDMKKAYALASVVVTPSVCFDSFPNTNLEAFASARPVVATCFGGSKEIVQDGENGFIVNPFNTDDLAAKILNLLMDTEKAKKFGQNGHQLVVQKFSIEKITQEYLSLFSQ